MSKRYSGTALLVAFLISTSPVFSYDAAMAESYAKLFAPVKGAEVGQALHLMKPDQFVAKLKAKEKLVTLDIRTPGETEVFGASLPGSLTIPFNELFSKENLDLIPTDKTVVILCKSGTRAGAAGTALRHIGFNNVYILSGGFTGLSSYLGAKEANTPL